MNYNDIDDYNHLAEILPPHVKEECSESGDNTYACEYWAKELGLSIPREKIIEELRGFDFTEDCELLSDFDLNVRYLWIAASCEDESINDAFSNSINDDAVGNLSKNELNEILELLEGVK